MSLSAVVSPTVAEPSITSAGDSVTALIFESGADACGAPLTAAAGLREGELVVTLTQVVNHAPCLSPPIVPPLEIVVQHVPSGTRPAEVVLRLVDGNEATYSRLASGSITVQ